MKSVQPWQKASSYLFWSFVFLQTVRSTLTNSVWLKANKLHHIDIPSREEISFIAKLFISQTWKLWCANSSNCDRLQAGFFQGSSVISGPLVIVYYLFQWRLVQYLIFCVFHMSFQQSWKYPDKKFCKKKQTEILDKKGNFSSPLL